MEVVVDAGRSSSAGAAAASDSVRGRERGRETRGGCYASLSLLVPRPTLLFSSRILSPPASLPLRLLLPAREEAAKKEREASASASAAKNEGEKEGARCWPSSPLSQFHCLLLIFFSRREDEQQESRTRSTGSSGESIGGGGSGGCDWDLNERERERGAEEERERERED